MFPHAESLQWLGSSGFRYHTDIAYIIENKTATLVPQQSRNPNKILLFILAAHSYWDQLGGDLFTPTILEMIDRAIT